MKKRRKATEDFELTDAQAMRILREVNEVNASELSNKEKGKFIAAIVRFKEIQDEINTIANDLIVTEEGSKFTRTDDEAVEMACNYVKDAFDALQAAKELIADIALVEKGKDGQNHYFIPVELRENDD